ncbi:hypothetical protein GE061_018178 [Apolygus lucorum]|uniref:Histone deacetylase domain-containing protein n=1 Tax=Apolygus lucorum TaxID=248454 RepID=A0A6A4IU91_APOLU|nr:hypothetical protein GE061_018178 [Apolygus lucorum]
MCDRNSNTHHFSVELKPGQQLPIVYHPRYNLQFFLMDKLHPVDGHKWGRIFNKLGEIGIREEHIHLSREPSMEELLYGNTAKHLKSLKNSWKIASSTDIWMLAFVPNFYLQRKVLRPMRYQVYGTLLAGQLALKRGWAINIGGGFHQSSRSKMVGMSLYADISLLVNYLFENISYVKKIMIVNLDGHQGCGFETDFMDCDNVYIMDVYSRSIRPRDEAAKLAIKCQVELKSRTRDFEYLSKVETNFLKSLNAFTPDLVIFNAGTCILQGDIANLSISPEGIVKRDQLIFVVCRQRKLPIVMLTSGGFTRKNAGVVADSIKNLFNLKIIGIE